MSEVIPCQETYNSCYYMIILQKVYNNKAPPLHLTELRELENGETVSWDIEYQHNIKVRRKVKECGLCAAWLGLARRTLRLHVLLPADLL